MLGQARQLAQKQTGKPAGKHNQSPNWTLIVNMKSCVFGSMATGRLGIGRCALYQ